MTAKENYKLEAFFSEDRKCFKDIVFMLLHILAKEINFNLKFQKASIQLCDKFPFAVIAFRRKNPYFFIEFYTSEKYDNLRIKIMKESGKEIINRVNILSSKDIDTELLNWVQKSKAFRND